MTRDRIVMAIKVPAILAAAAGVVTIGLLTTPVASAEPPPGGCPDGQFPIADGSGCASIPDPTQYGCPPDDFECMFTKIGPMS